MPNSLLTHFNAAGEAHMVDVGDKSITQRIPMCEAFITMQAETLALIKARNQKK